MDAEVESVALRYARFARDEAPGRSARYEDWADGVARDPGIAAIVARLPDTRRQPPLVFAVTRLLGAPDAPFGEWAAWLRRNADRVVAECARRSIQTNEPLRCAALLPALSLVEGPVALLEVGASAGLCLYPDRYSYRYHRGDDVVALDPADGTSAVVLDSALTGAPALRLPEVVWRAGIDLQPRDARNPDDRAWIEGLVWPGEEGRGERIAAALDLVAADPPRMFAGDAVDLLAEVAAEAPAGAALVVTTPGVLAHVPRVRRRDLIDRARSLGRWITLDAPGLHDGWTTTPAPRPGVFALALDGDVLAHVDPLGGSVAWLAGEPAPRR